MGLYSATPKGPFIPGLEYAGEVVAIGAGVNKWQVGNKVMGVTRFGAYTSYLNIDARYIFPLPQSWSFEEGAGFMVQVLTAYYALVPLGALQSGQTVLIHSAAGGVGLQANRIAQKLGAYTVGVVGNVSKFDLLKKEGYNGAVVRTDNFQQDVRQALQGRELNLVLEAAGGKYFTWSYQLLAAQGRLITYGSAGFTPQRVKPDYPRLIWQYLRRPKIDPLKMTRENKSVMGFNLIWIYDKAELMHQLMQEINALSLPAPHIGHTFAFKELPQALRLFQIGGTTGKLVVLT
jgi:alcohol dehydrogenase